MNALARPKFTFPYPYEPSAESRLEAAHEREQRRKAAEDLEHMQSMTDKALSGAYGPEAKRVVTAYVNRHGRDAGSLEELRKLLRKVPGRTSG
jgi:hypothetical protein